METQVRMTLVLALVGLGTGCAGAFGPTYERTSDEMRGTSSVMVRNAARATEGFASTSRGLMVNVVRGNSDTTVIDFRGSNTAGWWFLDCQDAVDIRIGSENRTIRDVEYDGDVSRTGSSLYYVEHLYVSLPTSEVARMLEEPTKFRACGLIANLDPEARPLIRRMLGTLE